MINSRLRPFGTTIFSEMTRLAQEHGAINLAQGFPDFEGPSEVVAAAQKALAEGHNQYARSMGRPELVHAVARHQERFYGLRYDPLTEVGVFSGATEAICAFLLGVLEPGDEVVLFEPFYDSYPAVVALAGAQVRPYTLEFPDFALDLERLASLFNERTRVVVLNTPHNPTGKVFSRGELEAIARLCERWNCVVLSDEVYEHLTYDDAAHVPMASVTGMRERTFSVSSSGKTFSFTGWKIGWGTGPAHLVQAAQAAHQFLTFATATPLQIAAAAALDLPDSYYLQLKADYTRRRDYLLRTLREVGLEAATPRGAYFVLADFGRVFDGDDRAFARFLTATHKVAAIPPSPFYAARPEAAQRLVRFAFCKRDETLSLAAQRLAALAQR